MLPELIGDTMNLLMNLFLGLPRPDFSLEENSSSVIVNLTGANYNY